jgi:hypothetical protein
VAALENKQVQILDETKKAKSKARAIEEAAQLDADNKAKDDGNFEQLYKSSEQARQTLQTDFEALTTTVASKERDASAMRLAMTMADGDNAELLSEQIAKRLKFTDGSLKVTDANGNLTVSTLDDLANEFKNNPRYGALLTGNQSSGGSASGGKNSGGAANVRTRADFNTMNAVAQAKFMKEGGSLTE